MDFSSILDPVIDGEEIYVDMPPARTRDVVHQPFDLSAARACFLPYRDRLEQIRRDAEVLDVIDEPSAKQATAIAGEVKRLGRNIDQRRKELIDAPNQYVKGVNSMAKMFTEPAAEIEVILKRKLAGYQSRRELERRMREEAIRKAQEDLYRRQREEAEAAKIEPPPPPTPIPIKPETVTRSDDGTSAHVRHVWRAEVVDPDSVPREFCEPSMRLLNEAVKSGIREIPGVRIWQDLQTILRT